MAIISISGLASGLDTDEIISQLMELERIPMQRLQERQADLQVDVTAWQDIGSRLTKLLNALSAIKAESSFKAMTVTSSDQKVVTATATSTAAAGTYQIWVEQLAQAHRVASEQKSTGSLGLSGTFSITVNGTTKSVTVTAGATLEDIRDQINDTEAGAGTIVSASIVDRRLVLASKTTGSGGSMTFTDTDGVLKNLGLLNSDDTIKMTLLEAQDAVFQVDGLRLTRQNNTVDDAIAGVTLNLLAVSDADGDSVADPGEVGTLQIARDTQAAVNAVKAFVDQYNSVMDFIAGKLGKNASGEAGDLYGDPTLAAIQQRLRSLVFNTVQLSDTEYTSAGMVGISTGAVSGSASFDRSGKLTLDVNALTKALEDDPDAVYRLFASSGPDGIATRLSSYLTQVTKTGWSSRPGAGDGVISSKQKMLNQVTEDIEDQISRWEDRLAAKEQQLRNQFTAMETMIATLQSQAAWLAGLIG